MIKIELVIRHTDGKPDITCPYFECDHCKGKIEKASYGLLHWKEDKEKYVPIDGTFMILHKNPCSRNVQAQERAEGYSMFPWWELSWLIGYLVNNTDMDWGRLVEDFCPPSEIMEVKRRVRAIRKEDAGLRRQMF